MATGVSSSDPVLLLASGLNVPDDLLYNPADGTVLVGEHGDGHLAKVGGAAGLVRLPQVVPEAEGIVQIGATTYIADQYNARVVALTASGTRTVLQLVPVASGENLDGISIDLSGTGLVVPDSPHGTVLFVDTSGHITGRVGGFGRPAGSTPDPARGGYLIADEALSAVYELTPGGSITRLAAGLSGADDAVRDQNGHVLVILPAPGRLVDATAGTNVAAGLRNPQGLGFDGAQNLLVTESDSGRLDLVVTTFALTVPTKTVQLQPGQGVCYGILRAPGDAELVRTYQSVGAVPVEDPLSYDVGEVIPQPCTLAVCTVNLVVQGPSGLEFGSFTYRD